MEVEAGIGPFVEHGADEALGLAVGLGTVGAGHGVAGAEVLAGLAEVGVGKGAIGHDPFDAHATIGEAGGGIEEEAGGGWAAFVGEGGHIGHPRGVVDGDVEEVVAAAPLPAPPGPAGMRPSFFTSRCKSSPARSLQ